MSGATTESKRGPGSIGSTHHVERQSHHVEGNHTNVSRRCSRFRNRLSPLSPGARRNNSHRRRGLRLSRGLARPWAAGCRLGRGTARRRTSRWRLRGSAARGPSDDHFAALVHGDAEDAAGTRHAVQGVAVHVGQRPGRRAPGRFARGDHVAARVHGDAEAAAGTGHPC